MNNTFSQTILLKYCKYYSYIANAFGGVTLRLIFGFKIAVVAVFFLLQYFIQCKILTNKLVKINNISIKLYYSFVVITGYLSEINT